MEDLTAARDAALAAAPSWKASSVMDYWLGNDRVKGEVWIMGKPGAKLRVNALSPAGGSVLSDLACDGTSFAFEDRQTNCVLAGPCDESSIRQFFGVALAPDEFTFLSLGLPPWWDPTQASSVYDAGTGRQVITMPGPRGRQVLDYQAGQGGTWHLVKMRLEDPTGKALWTVEHKDFHAVKAANGQALHLPGASRFRSPGEKADLIVDWKQQDIGLELAPEKFELTLTPGLPLCGAPR